MNQVSFSELNLSPEIERAVEEMGFEFSTEIQAKSIPLIKAGNDLVGRSQTGTGKTVAFGIPAIELIDNINHKREVQVLILCPTRELAMQACDEMRKLAKYKAGVKAVAIYGGDSMTRQISALKGGANIIIGTPGRVMDHMRRKTIKLDHLRMIILDEADEMLSMGFREDIETILTDTPDDRQTILFSATMPPAIMSLTKSFQKDPEIVQVSQKRVTLDNISQEYFELPMGRKMDGLNLLLKYTNPKLSIIFCNTKKMVDELAIYLNQHGFKAEGLHGDMKQAQRTRVMDSFKAGKVSLLIATDVAARGIDVDDVDSVINYDIPQNYEYYVHRIGRTGRAGKTGCAYTLCSGRRQINELNDIGRTIKADIQYKELPTSDDIIEIKRVSRMEKLENIISENDSFTYMSMVEELIAKGHNPKELAAAALEMHYGKEKISIPAIKAKSEKRNYGGGFSKIVISIGRSNGIAPNFIVGAVAERTNLSGKDIGKIEIFDNRTIVEVPQAAIDSVLASMKDCKINGIPTTTKLFEGGSSSRSRDGRDRDFKAKDFRGSKSFRDRDKDRHTGGKSFHSGKPQRKGSFAGKSNPSAKKQG